MPEVAAAVAAVKANEVMEALEAAVMAEEILTAAVDKQTLAVVVEEELNTQTTP